MAKHKKYKKVCVRCGDKFESGRVNRIICYRIGCITEWMREQLQKERRMYRDGDEERFLYKHREVNN